MWENRKASIKEDILSLELIKKNFLIKKQFLFYVYIYSFTTYFYITYCLLELFFI